MTQVASPLSKRASSKMKRRMMRSITVPGDGPNVPQPSRRIPVPDVPVWPILSAAAFLEERKSSTPSVLNAGHSVYVTAGRIAIGLALRLAGVAPGDKVLLPAYHCASMVDPLSCVSGSPVFYRLNEDLRVDLEDIARKIDASTHVLIAINYFGFPQDLEKLRKFCDDHHLVLIEDCAHSFFGEFEGRPLGSYGDYAIASLTKFFPVKEGGCLISTDPEARKLLPRSRGPMAGLQQGFLAIEDAVYHDRLTTLRPLVQAIHQARRLRPRPKSSPKSQDVDGPAFMRPGISEGFDPGWLDVKSSGISMWISRNVSTGRIARRRREFFGRMLAHFTAHRGCRPLITELPEGVVPYMFPLWVDDLSTVFPALEDRAVPMQRFGQFLWPGVDENLCRTSVEFSKHLIQLPCHQDLREDELDWVLETVSSVIASSR